MTDKEIIEALYCCKPKQNRNCGNCPAYELGDFCAAELKEDALDLIKRQQAEIERLKDGCSSCCVLRAKSETISELNEQIEYWQRGYNDLLQENKKAKSAAIKEFAERLKEKLRDVVRYDIGEHTYYMVGESLIDNLVKEMVGWVIMFLHYNNGQEKKLITDILCIQIIDENAPATATLRNGKELRIRLDRIETILDDEIRSDNNAE